MSVSLAPFGAGDHLFARNETGRLTWDSLHNMLNRRAVTAGVGPEPVERRRKQT